MARDKRKLPALHVQQRSVSSYVACPACQMQVSSRLINLHLDLLCPALSSTCGCSMSFTSDDGLGADIVSNSKSSLSEDHSSQPLQSRSSCIGEAEQSAKETVLLNETFEKKPSSPCATCRLVIVEDAGRLTEHIPLSNEGHDLSRHTSLKHTESELFDSETSLHHDDLKNETEACLAGDVMEKIKKGSFMKYFSEMPALHAPSGHYILEEFITPEEEKHILYSLDIDQEIPWKLLKYNGLYRGKAYGQSVDLRKRIVLPPVYDMPKFLMKVIERMEGVVPTLEKFVPNETNAIDYRRNEGHYLKPHVDDRQLSGLVILNLSLVGSCFMTYERERGCRESYRVKLNRRSLQILTGDSRWNFTHSIKNKDLLDSRRVSLTFRKCDLT